ncbi:MAG: S1C family serine protease [Thermoguttaceae bacterium]
MRCILRVVISIVFGLLLVGRGVAQPLAAVPVVPPPPQVKQLPANSLLESRFNELLSEERVGVVVYERCYRSVVNIDTVSTMTSFMLGEREIPGGGSGFVLDTQGHILTNFHVIEDVDAAQVTLTSGESFPAKLVGVDRLTDIAILKIDAPAEKLYPVTFGDSTTLLVGQRVFAIGNPFGLESTFTSGIISSLNRKFGGGEGGRPIFGAIQVDAAINPGNSGGPLLDTHGLVIGVNSAIASRVGENSGVGFAIPVATLKKIVPVLIRDGKVVRPDVGIAHVIETDKGLLVVQTVSGGAAEQAGIRGVRIRRETERRGIMSYNRSVVDKDYADTIVAVGEAETLKGDVFLTKIEEYKPGDRVFVTVLREGKRLQIPVTLK